LLPPIERRITEDNSSTQAKKETHMALQIATAEAEQRAREIAQCTGETPTQAIIVSLRERLARLDKQRQETEQRVDVLMALIERSAALPVLASRHPDDTIGYDEHGLPR